MVNRSVTASFLLAGALLATQAIGAAPARVGDFALIDIAGEFHQLSRYGDKEALVLMAFDASCGSMRRQRTMPRSTNAGGAPRCCCW